MRNHKVQEGSRVRSTPSDYQESLGMSPIVSIVKFHDVVIDNWQLALLLLSAAPRYLRYKGPRKMPACRDLDSCNPTTSTAASCIAISRSSTFPSIIVPPNIDLLSLSSFGCSVRTLAVATVIVFRLVLLKQLFSFTSPSSCGCPLEDHVAAPLLRRCVENLR